MKFRVGMALVCLSISLTATAQDTKRFLERTLDKVSLHKSEYEFRNQVLETLNIQKQEHIESIESAQNLLNDPNNELHECTLDHPKKGSKKNRFYAVIKNDEVKWFIEDDATYRDVAPIYDSEGNMLRRKKA